VIIGDVVAVSVPFEAAVQEALGLLLVVWPSPTAAIMMFASHHQSSHHCMPAAVIRVSVQAAAGFQTRPAVLLRVAGVLCPQVDMLVALEPTFGGVNLEDIKVCAACKQLQI